MFTIVPTTVLVLILLCMFKPIRMFIGWTLTIGAVLVLVEWYRYSHGLPPLGQ